ncbi:MAG: DUF2933 domain-containing protein [Pseudomonadota bacterium]
MEAVLDPANHKEHETHSHQGEAKADASRRRAKWAFIGFALIAAYFLITEHRAHLSGILAFLPFLLLAACPLLHLFHHGRHGGHGGGNKEEGGGK